MELGAPERHAFLRGARHGGDAVTRSGGFQWLARSGLLARGVVYSVIGVLAIKVAAGAGGKTASQQGALQTIAQQSFGEALLLAVAAGLAGYAFWRLTRALVGHGAQEADSATQRLASLGSGLVYAALCAIAVKILLGASAGNSGSPKRATAGVLGWSGGPLLVGIAGAVLIGVALYQAYKALARRFLEEANTARMSRPVRRAYEAIGVFGHLARTVVFGLAGYGLISAAADFDPRKAVGLDGALAELAHDSYGPYLLGVVAAGLIGFGLFSIADARYHRI